MLTSVNRKSLYRSKLTSILDYRKIHISGAELNSYSKKELRTLINRYDIKLYNADKRTNYLYATRFY